MRRTGTGPVSTCPCESFDNAPDGYRLAGPARLEGKRGGKAFSLAAEKNGFVFESDALIAHLDGGTLLRRPSRLR